MHDPLPPLKSRRGGRLGDTVVAHVVDRIVSGGYAVGTSLPTEPQLCEEFGISRTVIRESIKLLEEKGLVRATSGRGTQVLPRTGWNLLDPVVLEAQIRHDSELRVLDDLVEVRAALECEMAARCARVIGPEESAALARQLEFLATCVDDAGRYATEDVVFHEMIMAASGNQLGLAIIHSIHAKARLSGRYNGTPPPGDLAVSLAEHQRIGKAILAKDPDAAATQMRLHIVESWARRRPALHDRRTEPRR
ncbi:GntR family transcriptional regulator [Virgisporangium aliadipatigenens]|uniref:GntR family transcriptional regulator n=1 Tax=Virgisporangium aliadipatigenens TaxID=741659 RepID=A0A8J3YTW5_9ACTN|nr:FadR/GntR family transcriptional regulator [Virgisporangium aliadipatigenens]GIJ49673.1 GntR family transcriptional regulator [Virgisporangium aliadipatigenens]